MPDLNIERCRELIASISNTHRECDDCWYSCPKSEEGCCDDRYPKDECNCGTDKNIELATELEAALGEIERLKKELHAWKPTGPHTTEDIRRIIGDPRRGVLVKTKGD